MEITQIILNWWLRIWEKKIKVSCPSRDHPSRLGRWNFRGVLPCTRAANFAGVSALVLANCTLRVCPAEAQLELSSRGLSPELTASPGEPASPTPVAGSSTRFLWKLGTPMHVMIKHDCPKSSSEICCFAVSPMDKAGANLAVLPKCSNRFLFPAKSSNVFQFHGDMIGYQWIPMG